MNKRNTVRKRPPVTPKAQCGSATQGQRPTAGGRSNPRSYHFISPPWRADAKTQYGEKAPAHGAVGRCPAVLRTLIPGLVGGVGCLVMLLRGSASIPLLICKPAAHPQKTIFCSSYFGVSSFGGSGYGLCPPVKCVMGIAIWPDNNWPSISAFLRCMVWSLSHPCGT